MKNCLICSGEMNENRFICDFCKEGMCENCQWKLLEINYKAMKELTDSDEHSIEPEEYLPIRDKIATKFGWKRRFYEFVGDDDYATTICNICIASKKEIKGNLTVW